MKNKLFARGIILAVAALLFVYGVFADNGGADVSKSYHPKALYYITLKNRFPTTNEYAPVGFSCVIQTRTAPQMDLETSKLTLKDADVMIMQNDSSYFIHIGQDNNRDRDSDTLIQGKIDLVIDLLVNWDTAIIEEDTNMNDIDSPRYVTVYGLEKPRFQNFMTGVDVATRTTFKILTPRHKI